MKPFPTHPPVAPSKNLKLSWNDGSCVISLPRLTTSVDLRCSPLLSKPVETINKDGSKMKSEKTIDESVIIIKP